MKFFRENSIKNTQIIIKVSVSTAVLVFLFILSSYLFRNYQPHIESIVGTKSIIGMILFVIVFVASIVFAPISAMPLFPIGTRIWGVPITIVLSTAGYTMGSMIAFFLARRFGRPYVSKLIKKEIIEKLEKFVPEKNIFWTIFMFRVVTPVDGISYVLGLSSKISVKTFFWSTFLGLIPFCTVISILGSLPVSFLITGVLMAGIFTFFLIKNI